MNDNMKGKTLEDWESLILERMIFANGDEPEEVALEGLRSTLHATIISHEMPDENRDRYLERFKEAAGEYMALILRESLDTKVNTTYAFRDFKDKLAKLPSKIDQKRGQYSRFDLGHEVLIYIREHGDLPRSRKTLLKFIKDRGESNMSLTSLKDNLPWYDLDDICRTNEPLD